VINEDPAVREAIRARWGDSVFLPDGKIDRAAVGRRVFAEDRRADGELQFLQELLHPRIGHRLQQIGEQFDAEGKPAIVLDAPLLLEAGWKPFCDLIVMVDVPREIRLQRALERGWSEADFDNRESAQVSLDEKRRLSDVIIDNSGPEADLRTAVREFWSRYVAPA
jgi:dephospho-CoA kinase